MMVARKDVTEMLSACLVTEMDGFLSEQGFGRRKDSLRYSRQAGQGTQLFEAHYDPNPSYAPGAVAHLLPQLSVILPDLNKAVLDMVGDAPNLIASVRTTFSQQLQNAAPREVRTGQATQWFIFNPESARGCIVSMREFVKQWTIPFLNKYSTVAALTEGYEQQDECLPHDRRFWLFIAAAYTLLEQPTKAMQLLEDKLGKPMLRRRYAKAFEYVSARLAK
jgi:hypothetical protein